MKILIDECLPIRLKDEYSEHIVFTVQEMGWQGKRDSELLRLAVDKGFEIFITIDKNIEYQQNIKKIKLGIIVLDVPSIKLEGLKTLTKKVLELIKSMQPYNVHQLHSTIDIKKKKGI